MRIVHVINDLAVGGTENLLARHLACLRVEYPQVESQVVVLGGPEAVAGEYLDLLPIEPRYLEFSGRYRDPWEAFRCVSRLRGFLKESRPDLVHSYLWNADIFTAIARMGLGIPQVAHVVDRRGDRNANRLVARGKVRLTSRLLNRPDVRFAAVSEACRRHVLEHWLVAPDSVVTAPNGITLEHFDSGPRRLRKGAMPVLGTISNFKQEKGHHVLFEAMAELKRRGIPLRLKVAGGGRGVVREALELSIAKLELEDEVELVGRVSSASEFYRSIDLFVIPSIAAEGLPTTILEAMASRLPVVATDVGGAVEAVRNEMEGIIVPSCDPVALADAIASIATDPDRLLNMGEAGNARVRERFTIEDMTRDVVEQVYRPLLSACGNRPS